MPANVPKFPKKENHQNIALDDFSYVSPGVYFYHVMWSVTKKLDFQKKTNRTASFKISFFCLLSPVYLDKYEFFVINLVLDNFTHHWNAL